LSNIMNEGLIGSTCFLSNLSLPSIDWLTMVVIKTCIVKVQTSKGMISKHVPPFNGLTRLVTYYTTYGVIGTLLLVPISIDTKLEGSYLKSGKMIW